MTSTTYSDYGNGENDIAGTNYDWGVYNAIYNPKTNTTDPAGTWRTLTKDEWGYLLSTRKVTVGDEQKASYGQGTVNGVNGLIILPDNWDGSVDNDFTYGSTSWSSNTYTESTDVKLSDMEAVGVVFLPAAGFRNGTSVGSAGTYGNYWSATYSSASFACHLGFNSNLVGPQSSGSRYNGYSVRLVRDAN